MDLGPTRRLIPWTTLSAMQPNESDRRRLYLRLLLLLMILGIACRLCQYLSRRSFWHDEAMLILNVREKTPAQFFGALDTLPRHPQAAPPGFVLLEKAALHAWGGSELSLRLPAQVFGLLTMFLLAR